MSNKKLLTIQKVEKENKLPPKFNEQTNQTENIFDENEKEYPGQDHIESNLEDQKPRKVSIASANPYTFLESNEAQVCFLFVTFMT